MRNETYGAYAVNSYTMAKGSKSSIGKLPKKLPLSPYASRNNSLPDLKKVKSKKSQVKEDVPGLEYCYKRVCRDDSAAFRLLMRNQHQFGKQKIALKLHPDEHTTSPLRSTSSFKTIHNSFPRKKPPYVPLSFLNSSKKKKITTTFVLHKNNRTPSQKRKENDLAGRYPTESDCQPTASVQDVILDLKPVEKDEKYFKLKEDTFLEINKELLRDVAVDDDDYMIVPGETCAFFSDNTRQSVSYIFSEGLNIDNRTASSESDDSIVAGGVLFVKPAVNMKVLNEHGEDIDVEVFSPGTTDLHEKIRTDELLEETRQKAFERKEELRKLLNEYSEIAKEINSLELDSK